MQEEMTKDKLLEMIQSSRSRFEDLVASIDRDKLTQPGVEGEWSVKDLLTHIAVWEARMLKWIRRTLKGEIPWQLANLTQDDLDRMNRKSFQEHKDRPLDEVLAGSDASYNMSLKAVQATPEDALLEADRFEWRDGKPLWHMVAANTYWHYDDHRQAIERWLEEV